MNDYFENSEIFENFDDEIFFNSNGTSGENTSSVDVTQLISEGLKAGTEIGKSFGSSVRLNEEAKVGIAYKKIEQAKNKAIKTECGRKPFIGKNKKDKYENCRKEAIKKFEAKIEQSVADKDMQRRSAMAQAEQNKKSSQRNLYIGIGVVILLVGAVIYFKQKS